MKISINLETWELLLSYTDDIKALDKVLEYQLLGYTKKDIKFYIDLDKLNV